MLLKKFRFCFKTQTESYLDLYLGKDIGHFRKII